MINLQPVSGLQWYVIGTGLGTTVVRSSASVLGKIVIPGTYVGTIIFYDTDSVSGTADACKVFSLGLPLVNTFQTVTPDLQFKTGITVDSQGTPLMTLGLK